MAGIKETKEAVIGINKFTKIVMKHLKDGLDISDPIKIWRDLESNKDAMAAFSAAIDGWRKIPAEVADLDTAEAMELGQIQLMFILDLFKKK